MDQGEYSINVGIKAAKCTISLLEAIRLASGKVEKEILNMPLGEFIARVAGPNNIFFVYNKEPEKYQGIMKPNPVKPLSKPLSDPETEMIDAFRRTMQTDIAECDENEGPYSHLPMCLRP